VKVENNETQEDQVLEILRALKKIQYGSIEITIHGSKIVQIEVREKVRFEKQPLTN
jgi:hypothetical protein